MNGSLYLYNGQQSWGHGLGRSFRKVHQPIIPGRLQSSDAINHARALVDAIRLAMANMSRCWLRCANGRSTRK